MADDDARRKAEEALAAIDLGDWSILLDDTSNDLREIYGDGLQEGLLLTGMDINLDQVNELALSWARDRAAALVTQLEGNTRDLVRDTVAEAIEQGWSADQLASELEASAGFDSDRAQMISRTELLAANNQGNLAGYKQARDSGVRVMKEWITAGDDLVSEECEANEDQGPIELDDAFDSGDDSPPAHPNCRCAVTPYLPDEEGDGEQEEEG